MDVELLKSLDEGGEVAFVGCNFGGLGSGNWVDGLVVGEGIHIGVVRER